MTVHSHPSWAMGGQGDPLTKLQIFTPSCWTISDFRLHPPRWAAGWGPRVSNWQKYRFLPLPGDKFQKLRLHPPWVMEGRPIKFLILLYARSIFHPGEAPCPPYPPLALGSNKAHRKLHYGRLHMTSSISTSSPVPSWCHWNWMPSLPDTFLNRTISFWPDGVPVPRFIIGLISSNLQNLRSDQLLKCAHQNIHHGKG